MTQLLLLANLAATLLMTGVIWFVQVVHYPLMACVEKQSSCYIDYQKRHMAQTTWVVLPPMVTELLTALGMLFWPCDHVPYGAVIAGLGLVVLIWLSTFLLQVPRHQSLLEGFSDLQHRRLVRSNWIRTILWTTRALLLLWIVLRNMSV